jgi:hydroxymethylpyrimidine pyrophosphatase-like HAD family hydrolase
VRFTVLACDFDGTIAIDGVVDPAVVAALRRVRSSGRRLLLVTGRTRDQLEPPPAGIELFDLLVLENGGLLVDPRSGRERSLGPPLPAELVARLKEQAVPVHAGRVICAVPAHHSTAVSRTIREMGLRMHTVLNRDWLMVLPEGMSKATGTLAALGELGQRMEACVAVGDAENDVAFLAAAGCGVAVGDPPASLRAVADLVLEGPDGAGFVQLAQALVEGDLAGSVPVTACPEGAAAPASLSGPG